MIFCSSHVTSPPSIRSLIWNLTNVVPVPRKFVGNLNIYLFPSFHYILLHLLFSFLNFFFSHSTFSSVFSASLMPKKINLFSYAFIHFPSSSFSFSAAAQFTTIPRSHFGEWVIRWWLCQELIGGMKWRVRIHNARCRRSNGWWIRIESRIKIITFVRCALR